MRIFRESSCDHVHEISLGDLLSGLELLLGWRGYRFSYPVSLLRKQIRQLWKNKNSTIFDRLLEAKHHQRGFVYIWEIGRESGIGEKIFKDFDRLNYWDSWFRKSLVFGKVKFEDSDLFQIQLSLYSFSWVDRSVVCLRKLKESWRI